MTKLYVKEFGGLARTEQSDSVPVFPVDNSAADQVVDYTAAAAASAPFNAKTKWVLLSSDSGCSIAFSPVSAPVVATALNFRLPANTPTPFRLPDLIPTVNTTAPTWQVSAITNP